MISIAPVSADDAPFLFELFCSTRWDEISSWGLEPKMAEQLLHMQWRAQTQSYQQQFPHMKHWIISADKKKAGRIIVDQTQNEIHVVDISVLPAFRNQGIGTHLLREWQREAREKEMLLTLRVYASNPARRLYDRLGFSVSFTDDLYVWMQWSGEAYMNEKEQEKKEV
ncbi:GNAT family N-acetyltransferase [Brevibacillus nitrificans]|uniref:GNAT family N-acetyltransferase n=1 Tax=Brevibacillus nitrificans TaxID=651560 RepID=UPI0028643A5F|nr:GNAT family N-acetyltransferase [Brevibacillus nitrificans]MDR7316993.1 ribosomal protein S18 acetylase RimI-like enzyme [Brevibacillus nitrificans]